MDGLCFQIERIGPKHQAGSDSLLTGASFFKMREVCIHLQRGKKFAHVLQTFTECECANIMKCMNRITVFNREPSLFMKEGRIGWTWKKLYPMGGGGNKTLLQQVRPPPPLHIINEGMFLLLDFTNYRLVDMSRFAGFGDNLLICAMWPIMI